MKTIAKVLIAVMVVGGGLLLSGFTSGDNNAAGVTKDAGCYLYDGYGSLVLANSDITVVNNGGNTTLTCKAKGVATPGYTVKFKDFLCYTFSGFTSNTYNVVSDLGDATLRCQIKK